MVMQPQYPVGTHISEFGCYVEVIHKKTSAVAEAFSFKSQGASNVVFPIIDSEM